jgi:hypothetical protein
MHTEKAGSKAHMHPSMTYEALKITARLFAVSAPADTFWWAAAQRKENEVPYIDHNVHSIAFMFAGHDRGFRDLGRRVLRRRGQRRGGLRPRVQEVPREGSVRIRYEEAGSGFPLLLFPGGDLNSTIAGLHRATLSLASAREC